MILLLNYHKIRIVGAIEAIHIVDNKMITIFHIDVDVRLLNRELGVVQIV